jgi:hypothetical protein
MLGLGLGLGLRVRNSDNLCKQKLSLSFLKILKLFLLSTNFRMRYRIVLLIKVFSLKSPEVSLNQA